MKYILKKEYPGSPKLGTIINDSKTTLGISYYENCKGFIGNFPEFWKLIVEYPIGTKVHNSQTNTTYTKKEDGWYKPSEKTGYNDEMIIKSHYINIIEDKVVEKDYEILEVKGKYGAVSSYIEILDSDLKDKTIFKIKRLSDGEIFTIGDITNYDIIKKIKVNNDSFCIITKDYDLWNKSKTIVNFCKQPIFKTEDCVDIFEGDNIYWVNINTFEKVNCNKYNDDLGEISIKSLLSKKYECKAVGFSTKEKAEEYILLNKPCLSYNEVLNATKIRNKNTFETLKDLVKSKIQQSV